jgi:hypothetical protein
MNSRERTVRAERLDDSGDTARFHLFLDHYTIFVL